MSGLLGIAARKAVVSDASRTDIYAVDGQLEVIENMRILFRVDVSTNTVRVRGLSLLASSDQASRVTFDTSEVTQDVSLVVPANVSEVVLGGGSGGGSTPFVITLGPAGDGDYDANTVSAALALADAQPTTVDVLIRVFPGTYETDSIYRTDRRYSFEGQGSSCVIQAQQTGSLSDDFLFHFDGTFCVLRFSELTIDLRGQPFADAIRQECVSDFSGKLEMHGVTVLSGNQFEPQSSVLRIGRLSRADLENCVFSQGFFVDGTLPRDCIHVSGCRSLRIENCSVGNDDAAFVHSCINLEIASESFSIPVEANIVGCRIANADAYNCYLKITTPGRISVRDCVLTDAGTSSFYIDQETVNRSGAFVVSGCTMLRYGSNRAFDVSDEIVDTRAPLMVYDCKFGNARGALRNALAVTSSKSTDHDTERIIVQDVLAPIVNVGDTGSYGQVSLCGRIVYPQYVFTQTAGGFSDNLADVAITTSFDSVTAFAVAGDILWIGTPWSEASGVAGVQFKYLSSSGKLVEVVQGDTFPPMSTNNISRFIHKDSTTGAPRINFQQPFASQSTNEVTATPYNIGELGAASGTVNGILANWIGLRRLDSGFFLATRLGDIRIVESSPVLVSAETEPLSLVPSVSLKYINLDLRAVDLGGGVPAETAPYLGPEQRVLAFELQGSGLALGEQGVVSMVNLREWTNVQKPSAVRVTMAAAQGNISNAEIRVQVTGRCVQSGSTTSVTIAVPGGNNTNYHDSGFQTVPAMTSGNMDTMEFDIPANTFMQGMPILSSPSPQNRQAYTFFVQVSRNATRPSDSDVSSLFILGAELAYSDM